MTSSFFLFSVMLCCTLFDYSTSKTTFFGITEQRPLNVSFYNLDSDTYGQIVGNIPTNFYMGSSATWSSNCANWKQGIIYAALSSDTSPDYYVGVSIDTGDIVSVTPINDDQSNIRGVGVTSDNR